MRTPPAISSAYRVTVDNCPHSEKRLVTSDGSRCSLSASLTGLMADYDFHQLSPRDLERLARDLLQAELGVTLESFKTGRDSGIDLRYAATNQNIIVQCK